MKHEDGYDETLDIIKDSKLFRNDFFGRTDSEAHIVTEGRFAFQTVDRNFSFATHSPYGYLRAPWNINPLGYVARYHKMCGISMYDALDELQLYSNEDIVDYEWPTCASHWKTALSKEYSTWYDWAWAIGYLPHGPMHAWIGGVGGHCDEFSAL